MTRRKYSTVRLALPSKGALEQPTLTFLAGSGLKVHRPNVRQYLALVPSLPDVTVLFQRAPDIFEKVSEGSVQFGITGYDIVCEHGVTHEQVVVMKEKLGYGACQLVLAVPEGWIDVSSINDLADLAVLYKERGRELRIATKYVNLTKQWLYSRGITNFALVQAQGALEVAPSMGYADLIADITSSGTTLRENRLKLIEGGLILKSEACLIANRKTLKEERVLRIARVLLELFEARLRAQSYVSISASLCGESEESLAKKLTYIPELDPLRGPTISRLYTKSGSKCDWFTATIVTKRENILETVHHLRKFGGTDIVVGSLDYLFDATSWDYESFLDKLRRTDVE